MMVAAVALVRSAMAPLSSRPGLFQTAGLLTLPPPGLRSLWIAAVPLLALA